MPANSERPLRAFRALTLLPVFLSLVLLSGCKEEVAKVAPAAPASTTGKTADPGASR